VKVSVKVQVFEERKIANTDSLSLDARSIKSAGIYGANPAFINNQINPRPIDKFDGRSGPNKNQGIMKGNEPPKYPNYNYQGSGSGSIKNQGNHIKNEPPKIHYDRSRVDRAKSPIIPKPVDSTAKPSYSNKADTRNKGKSSTPNVSRNSVNLTITNNPPVNAAFNKNSIEMGDMKKKPAAGAANPTNSWLNNNNRSKWY
jgi:hypothetical protein